jgi:hypothetical protein
MGLEPTEVTGPLAQFKAVKAEKYGTKKLLQTINHVQGENPLSEDRLNIIFNTFWPSLEQTLKDISNSPQEKTEPKRSLDDKVDEILNIVREQSWAISSISLNTNQLAKYKVEMSDGEIESRLEKLIIDFRVPESEAIKSVQNYFLKEAGVKTRRKRVEPGDIKI